MKIALSALALVLAAMPLAAPAQATRPSTDSERGAALRVEHRMIHPDAARKAPLAYGYVNEDGTTASGTSNFTSSYNSSAGWYVITITNIDYFFSSYSTVVTPSLPHNAICDTDSVSGTLLVRCFDTSGNPVQAEFGFITF